MNILYGQFSVLDGVNCRKFSFLGATSLMAPIDFTYDQDTILRVIWGYISSVIRQKGESENGCFKNTKHVKFSEQRIRGLDMFVFRKIWRALCSWNTRFEIRPFALLPTIYTLKFKRRWLWNVIIFTRNVSKIWRVEDWIN